MNKVSYLGLSLLTMLALAGCNKAASNISLDYSQEDECLYKEGKLEAGKEYTFRCDFSKWTSYEGTHGITFMIGSEDADFADVKTDSEGNVTEGVKITNKEGQSISADDPPYYFYMEEGEYKIASLSVGVFFDIAKSDVIDITFKCKANINFCASADIDDPDKWFVTSGV